MKEWTAERLPHGWEDENNIASRGFADTWLQSQRSAVVIVPSAVAKYEKNVLIYPAHPDFKWIVASTPEAVVWDARLFRRGRA